MLLHRACVKDPSAQKSLRHAVCQMPLYQHDESRVRPRTEEPCVASTKFHFDSEAGECVQVEYEGCFGTGNIFDSEDECKQFCGDESKLAACCLYVSIWH